MTHKGVLRYVDKREPVAYFCDSDVTGDDWHRDGGVGVRARVEAYVPGGSHHMYDPRTGLLVEGHRHWDWRWKVLFGDVVVARRAGFCSHERAMRSLANAWPRLERNVEDACGRLVAGTFPTTKESG